MARSVHAWRSSSPGTPTQSWQMRPDVAVPATRYSSMWKMPELRRTSTRSRWLRAPGAQSSTMPGTSTVPPS